MIVRDERIRHQGRIFSNLGITTPFMIGDCLYIKSSPDSAICPAYNKVLRIIETTPVSPVNIEIIIKD